MTDGSGPAFPSYHGDGTFNPTGMTLRDYFAAKAMQGIVAQGGAVSIVPELFSREAALAYAFADAMLAERAK